MRLDNTKQLAHGTELLLPFVLLLQMVPRYSRNRDLHAIGLVGYLSQVRLRVSTRSHNVPDIDPPPPPRAHSSSASGSAGLIHTIANGGKLRCGEKKKTASEGRNCHCAACLKHPSQALTLTCCHSSSRSASSTITMCM